MQEDLDKEMLAKAALEGQVEPRVFVCLRQSSA